MSVTPMSRQIETSMPPTIFIETMSMGLLRRVGGDEEVAEAIDG